MMREIAIALLTVVAMTANLTAAIAMPPRAHSTDVQADTFDLGRMAPGGAGDVLHFEGDRARQITHRLFPSITERAERVDLEEGVVLPVGAHGGLAFRIRLKPTGHDGSLCEAPVMLLSYRPTHPLQPHITNMVLRIVDGTIPDYTLDLVRLERRYLRLSRAPGSETELDRQCAALSAGTDKWTWARDVGAFTSMERAVASLIADLRTGDRPVRCIDPAGERCVISRQQVLAAVLANPPQGVERMVLPNLESWHTFRFYAVSEQVSAGYTIAVVDHGATKGELRFMQEKVSIPVI